ncbi:lipocalin-like domain-containing protein [Sphingobacterium chungjuense]|uniref:lipocalin family protein n=1 Tax=Sphingobacterium chungjuense TaxID=2675553 RepID=UPI00140BEE04|nr:lipocalin family protein [Sphingobacterium chungjuense]
MKLIRYLPLIVVALLNLLGCVKDESYARQIIGTWEITHYDGRVVADHPEEFPQPRNMTFQSDGAFYETGTSRDGFGSYSINGGDIIIYMQGRAVFTIKIISIDGSSAFLDVSTQGSAVGIKLKKMK